MSAPPRQTKPENHFFHLSGIEMLAKPRRAA
jgi:hypothetical protein